MQPPNTSTAIYSYTFRVPQQALDQNGHVNNVQYVQWMQDIAVRHYESLDGVAPTQALGATWVVHSHKIEYLRPAFAGDEIEARTWVANLRKVRSLRRYEFIRKSDGVLLVRGETDWVFVDAQTGRPLSIPESIREIFSLVPER